MLDSKQEFYDSVINWLMKVGNEEKLRQLHRDIGALENTGDQSDRMRALLDWCFAREKVTGLIAQIGYLDSTTGNFSDFYYKILEAWINVPEANKEKNQLQEYLKKLIADPTIPGDKKNKLKAYKRSIQKPISGNTRMSTGWNNLPLSAEVRMLIYIGNPIMIFRGYINGEDDDRGCELIPNIYGEKAYLADKDLNREIPNLISTLASPKSENYFTHLDRAEIITDPPKMFFLKPEIWDCFCSPGQFFSGKYPVTYRSIHKYGTFPSSRDEINATIPEELEMASFLTLEVWEDYDKAKNDSNKYWGCKCLKKPISEGDLASVEKILQKTPVLLSCREDEPSGIDKNFGEKIEKDFFRKLNDLKESHVWAQSIVLVWDDNEWLQDIKDNIREYQRENN